MVKMWEIASIYIYIHKKFGGHTHEFPLMTGRPESKFAGAPQFTVTQLQMLELRCICNIR